jgi:hypothetical protein
MPPESEEAIPAECQPVVRKYRRQLKKARQVLFSLSQRVDLRRIPSTLKDAVNRQRKALQEECADDSPPKAAGCSTESASDEQVKRPSPGA